MSRKNPWREPSNLIAVVAGVLSLVSLGVSVRSCQTADRSLALAAAEYRAQRSMILGATLSSNGDAFTVKALDSSISLLDALAIFPTDVEKQEWRILPPDYQLHMLMLRTGLERAVEKHVGRTPGHATVSIDANVPVAIKSFYTAKGEPFQNQALYRIVYSFVIDGDSDKAPKVEFKGLTYMNRLGPDDDARKLIDEIWEQQVFSKK